MKSPHRFPLNYALAALATGMSLAAPHAFAQTADATAGLERVTITSEKRLTVLDKTPDAISAISGSRLAEMGASGLEDVLGLVPNASFISSYGGSKITLRGVGINGGSDPGVATYVDGSYVSDLAAVNTGLFDLQRVEVLRGPQGALYGRNATGGAVNYVTATPTQDRQGQASVLAGDYGRKETEGFVSGALGDTPTSARLSWQIKARDGFTKNTVAGNSYASVFPGNPGTVGPDKLDDLKTQSLRLQTLTDMGAQGTVRLIVGSHKEDDTGPNIAVLPQSKQVSQYLFGVAPGSDRYVTSSNGQSNLVDTKTAQVIYERPVGDNTLTASVSYRKSNSALVLDSDSTAALVQTTSLFNETTDKSIDLHLASAEGNSLQWLVGATTVDYDLKFDSQFQQQFSLGLLTGIAARNGIAVPNNLLLGGVQKMHSTALYADMRYALTPTVAVRGGLRANKDQKDVTEYQTTATGTRTAVPTASWDSAPGNIGLEWNLDKETMLYGKLSKGFKAGAINMGLLQATSVNPETVVSTELGLKASFLNNRGAFSAAVFSSDYKDMQFSQITTQSQALINAPGAKINGLEMELLVKPVSALILGANVGLMDPKFSDFSNTNSRNPTAGVVSLNGNQITNVSKAQASLSADYTQVIGEYKTTFRADYVWRDKFYFTEFNDADTMQEAYGVLNLAASVKPSGSKWKLYAQLKNATDTQAYTSMTTSGTLSGGQRNVTYTPPRTFGIGVSLDF
jgi:outer membrane receptor protein involved in Fe transport